MRASNTLLLSALLLAVLLGSSGCSLFGYWAGSSIDSSSEVMLVLPPDRALMRLETGDEVICRLDDGSMLGGVYAGMEMPTRQQLIELMHEKNAGDCAGGSAVAVGEELILQRRDRAPETVRFLAADASRLWYASADESEVRLLLFEHISVLTRCNGVALKPPFEPLVKQGVFDSPRFLRLLDAGVPQLLDTATVREVTFRHRPVTGRVVLTVLGAVTDGVLLAIATKKKDSPPPPPVKPKEKDPPVYPTGCPVVEGWDGKDWRREVECLPGAFYRASQRSDVAPLDRVRPVNGLLRLRVLDILEEIDSIDHLGMLCVDHPAGSVVYPTEEGRLLAVSPSGPLAASDDRGRDVRTQLLAADDEHWLALPVADPARRGQRRWIECRFPLPAGADSVTLLLRLCNTQWSSELHGHFLSLYGRELQAQYDLLNTSAEARTFLRTRFEQEAMLTVSVWDGQGWRSTGTVREVGHLAWRDVARRIDVRGIDAAELRIRFDAPASIWMVDRVALDTAPPKPVSVTRLSLVSAERDDGRRCASLLRAVDGDYLVLNTGEWMEAAFRVPPAHFPDRQRSFLVEMTGYYRPLLHPEAAPQTALLERILGERGYFAEYADGLFWDGLTAMTNDR